MDFSTTHWPAVAVAALVGFPLGMAWYGPLFGKAWREASGVTMARAKAANPALIYPTVLLLNLIATTSLSRFVGSGDIHAGTHIGLLVGATFVAVGFGINYLFEFRPVRLWLINSGYVTVFFTMAGAILGAWH
jgi:hypothetical protein